MTMVRLIQEENNGVFIFLPNGMTEVLLRRRSKMQGCQAVVKGEKCCEKATHIGTVVTMKDGLKEVLACEKHANRKGFFGYKIAEEATIS